MMHARCLTVAAMLLALAPTIALALPLPYGAQIERVADDDELRFRVDVFTLDDAEIPPYKYRVIRGNTAPGLRGVHLFTDWLDFPPEGETYFTYFLDPEVQGLDAGQYLVLAKWETGHEAVLDEEWLALVEHPYVLRGMLLSDSTVEPCAGTGLLECDDIELANPDWWDDVGPGVLLDIYGWPVRLDGRDDCMVMVTWVEPMPPGSDCDDPMATAQLSWSALRALYQ